ncbi:hypothetical protein HYH03_012626 [Edaphochlamys debaryana]|uniref:YchJ-like middle NTF2-like domain-containing protein n=1 Tax=Edaphochlamys debaryana TaxID=47281 RepID=A0A835XSG0_9CHLO|nr:hypothetical protein HYH03_012626 [Edaphochlamys debaryana]|eukprot:KAG2488827.1 hypothetical protein HYH03_012626 [Edaphochlamys debaryana]
MLARRLPAPSAAGARRRAVIAQAKKGFGAPVKPKQVQKKDQEQPAPCPCESGKAYKNCCESIHTGAQKAATPEATLRARFSAYCKAQPDYVIRTTHPDYHINHYGVATPGGAPEKLAEDVAVACNRFAFMGLKVVKTEPGVNDHEGYVSFEYLSRKRSAPGAQVTEAEVKDLGAWSRTAERCRFLLSPSSGEWQFVDYQTATFDAASLGGGAAPAQ